MSELEKAEQKLKECKAWYEYDCKHFPMAAQQSAINLQNAERAYKYLLAKSKK